MMVERATRPPRPSHELFTTTIYRVSIMGVILNYKSRTHIVVSMLIFICGIGKTDKGYRYRDGAGPGGAYFYRSTQRAMHGATATLEASENRHKLCNTFDNPKSDILDIIILSLQCCCRFSSSAKPGWLDMRNKQIPHKHTTLILFTVLSNETFSFHFFYFHVHIAL